MGFKINKTLSIMGKKAVLPAIPLILLVSDLIIRDEVFPGFRTRQWSFYLLSFIYSILLYSALIIGLRSLYFYGNKGLYWISLLLTAFFYTVCLVGSYGYYAYTGIMPNFFVFSFLFQEPLNSWTIFWGGLTGGLVVLACLVFLLIASLLYLATKVRSQKFRFGKILRAASIFFFLLLTAFLHNNTRFNDQVYVSDTNTIAFVWRNVYNRLTGDNLGSAGLQSRNKPKLSNVSSKPAFNVLLIVAESLRKNNMSLYGYKKDTTPFLVRNVKNANHYSTFVFKQAFSNSSSTLLSFPSILSGVSPAQPVPMTHSFPLFWEYAKVLNYSTFYITSHDLQWNNFKGFFRNSSIDKIWDKEASGSGVFNDIGIDDRKTVEEFKRYVTFLKNKKEKFAGVLHFNTNHFPYIIPEEGKVFPVNTVPDQYDNSVRHMDNLLKEVYEFMESEGLTESTLVIFTSDHGESLFEHDYLGHIDSNHIETIAIPMIIRLPHALSKDGVRTEAIKRNTTRPVANTDIIPTMLDALDLEKKPDVKNYLPKLEGKSLLRDLDDERKIIVTNNNEISLYKVGISYLKGDLHYLMNLNTIPPREKLYDLSKDPNELRDLWPELSETEKEECRKELQECGLCRDLYESIGIRPMNSGATDSGKSRNKAVSVK